jgi:hypothetical protein
MVDVNEHLESQPLGWRKALARRFDRQVIDRVIFDKHPDVVSILLNNPRVTERDVVKVAALQPSTPQALREVFRHARWIRRYSVKKALIFNPYTPVSISLGLLSFLLEPDLLQASRGFKLAREVRERAKELLSERRGRHRVALTGLPSPTELELPDEEAESANDAAQAFLESLETGGITLTLLDDDDNEEVVSFRAPAARQPVPQEELEVEDEAEAFLQGLPRLLTLTPVGELDDEE